ncbi:MAG: 50S ribosomal protein L10 [Gemmataceae bacterium]|nr:50S ribosomal protein L10 [Gemmataceae bacterium]
MSKEFKNLEIDAIRRDFLKVRDMVIMEVQGITAQANTGLRSTLRKKNIRLKVVKNAYARKVFLEEGLQIPHDSPIWSGPTMVAWGANSIAELSREIDRELKNPKTRALYKDKVKIKSALADGLPVTFENALKMPTREEAIANIAGLVLAPGGRLASLLLAPGGILAGQVKSISENAPEGVAS